MIRRLLVGTAILLLIFSGLAIYGLHAPRPSLDDLDLKLGQIEVDGRQRTFRYVASPQSVGPMTVLLALHPSMSSGERMREFVGPLFEPMIQQQPMLVVYPDGFEGHFNDCRKAARYSARQLQIDDVGFLQAIVEQLATRYPLDRGQIHALGYSNGAHMAYRLAQEAPNFLRGLIAVAANLPTEANNACSRTRGQLTRAVLIQGTEDPINPYTGGEVTLWGFGQRGQVHSAGDSAVRLAHWLGIQGTATTPEMPPRSDLAARRRGRASGHRDRRRPYDSAGPLPFSATVWRHAARQHPAARGLGVSDRSLSRAPAHYHQSQGALRSNHP